MFTLIKYLIYIYIFCVFMILKVMFKYLDRPRLASMRINGFSNSELLLTSNSYICIN